MFFLKTKNIVVDVFTTRHEIAELFPITKSIEHVPNWWKNANKTFKTDFYDRPTLKACDGLSSLFSSGFILPLWTDLAIKAENKTYQWQASDFKTLLNVHDSRQWDMFLNPQENGHIKIISPYRMKDKSNIKWMLNNPAWHKPMNDWYNVLNGITNFKHRHEININIMIDLKNNYSNIIKAGTPILQLFPMTEKNVKLKHHVIDEKEFARMDIENISFTGSYKKRLAILNKPKKCPFHF